MAIHADSARTTGPVSSALIAARAAQDEWGALPLQERLRWARRMRAAIAARADEFAASVARPEQETLTAEVLPLAEACRFLERHAASVLAPRRLDSYKPLWMRSIGIVTRREPFGIILLIGPANYPLFLPGVQLIQALTAGNAVLLKPGVGGTAAARLLLECAWEAGAPRAAAVLLDESPDSATEAIRCGVDKVVITGSKASGQAVLANVSQSVIPVIAELSGWDPVFVLEDADLQLAAAAIRFGVTFNRGNTCIRPRVVYAVPHILAQLRSELIPFEYQLEFVPVATEPEALRRAGESEYALGATVFGRPDHAEDFARRVRAGVVVINDMIVPTAHPAVPFGGRGSSGFGVTRGAEGLLELTTIKTVITQRSGWRPHLKPSQPGDARLFSAFIRALHGNGIRNRLRACAALWHAARTRGKDN